MGQTEVLKLHRDLEHKHIEEGMLGQDEGFSSQAALGVDVCLVEGIVVDGHVMVLIDLPEQVGPMDAAGVKRAAVVEDEGRPRPPSNSPLQGENWPLSKFFTFHFLI